MISWRCEISLFVLKNISTLEDKNAVSTHNHVASFIFNWIIMLSLFSSKQKQYLQYTACLVTYTCTVATAIAVP